LLSFIDHAADPSPVGLKKFLLGSLVCVTRSLQSVQSTWPLDQRYPGLLASSRSLFGPELLNSPIGPEVCRESASQVLFEARMPCLLRELGIGHRFAAYVSMELGLIVP